MEDACSPCPKCGSARVRYPYKGTLTSPRCKPCNAEKVKARYQADPVSGAADSRRRYAANPEAIKARARADYYANVEQNKERSKAWSAANKERHAELRKRWRDANRARIAQYNHMYYDENREAEIARCIAYIKAHPEVDAASKARRNALKRAVVCEHGLGCVTSAFLKMIRASDCQYCGAPAAHADHFMPLVKGGLHCVKNIVPACVRCNTSKWAHDPVEWMTGRATRVPA